MPKSISVSLYAAPSLYEKIEMLAQAQHRSVSNLITLAMEEFLAKPEHVPLWSKNFGKAVGQVDLEDLISGKKRVPMKVAKHK